MVKFIKPITPILAVFAIKAKSSMSGNTYSYK